MVIEKLCILDMKFFLKRITRFCFAVRKFAVIFQKKLLKCNGCLPKWGLQPPPQPVLSTSIINLCRIVNSVDIFIDGYDPI